LKLDKNGLDLFKIDRIPFPSFKHQVSSILPLMAQTLVLEIFSFLVPACPG